jgi:hypothetical protein
MAMAMAAGVRSSRPTRRLALAATVGIALVWPFARRAVDVTATPTAPLEARAVQSIRAIQQGQRIYESVHGYYDRLECVIQDTCASIDSHPPAYLDASHAAATRFGYRFRFYKGARATAGRDETPSPTGITAYAMTAMPLDRRSGRPAFCGDDTGAVYRRADGRPPHVIAGRCAVEGRPVP